MNSLLHYLSFLLEIVRDQPGNKAEIPLDDGWFFPPGKTLIEVEVSDTFVKVEVKDGLD